jgi:hypothetical protein
MEAACIWLQPERVSEPARDILPDRRRKRAEGAPIYIVAVGVGVGAGRRII